VSAEIEKVVSNTNRLHSQESFPNVCETSFQIIARRHVSFFKVGPGAIELRQRAPIDLAA